MLVARAGSPDVTTRLGSAPYPPPPILVAVQTRWNSLDRPRVRPVAGRVSLSRPSSVLRPRPGGEGEPTAPRTVSASSAPERWDPGDLEAPNPGRAERIYGPCAHPQRASAGNRYSRGRHTRRQAPHRRVRQAVRHRAPHQRPRPAVLLGRAGALEVLRLRQRRPVHGHANRGLLDPGTHLPVAADQDRL
jgi:hypothetical protein